jgi:hypothetical protein
MYRFFGKIKKKINSNSILYQLE